jgi:hypothetical protein
MLNEQQLEQLCLDWFQEVGWRFAHGPDIAPDSSAPDLLNSNAAPVVSDGWTARVVLRKFGYSQAPREQVVEQVLDLARLAEGENSE